MGTLSRLKRLLALLLALALLAAACGSDDGGDGDADAADDAAEAVEDAADDSDDEPADDDDSGDSAAEPSDDSDDEPADEPDDDGDADDGGSDGGDSGDQAAAPEIGDPEIDTLRICQAPAFTGLAAHVAVTKGLLDARGITGEFIQCPSGPANAAALISRQVDVVGNTPDNMLGIRNADFDVVMFAQAVDTHFFDIIVSEGFGEIDCDQGDWECVMAALDGTSVGVVARGAAAEQIARQLYDSAGLNPDDATYIATGLAGTTLAALSSGEVDWAITFEPGLSQGSLDGIGYLPFSLRNGDGPAELDWPSLVLTTSRAVWDESPNAILHYRQAIVEAAQWIRDPANRDDVLAEMNTFLGVEGEIAEAILDNNAPSLTETGELDQARIEANVAYAVGRGILGDSQDFGEFAVGPDIEAILPDALVPETPDVNVCQAPSFSGLPAAVAANRGVFEANGLNVEFVACESGPANAAALIAGEVQFVGNTPDNMLGIRNADFDVVMFGQVINTHFFDIIVSNEFGEIDCEPGDWECVMAALDGTNVGVVARGAAAEQIARQLYDSAGLDPENATYIATGLAGTTLAALSSGEVDWAITFEPGLSQGVADGIGYLPFNLRGGDGPTELDWPSLVLTTSREFAEANPNTVANYRKSIREAADWIRNPANRAAVLEELTALTGVEGELAEAILDNNVGSFSLNMALQQGRIENNVAYAVTRGILDEAQDFAEFAFTGN
ncbi:MAG: ABC transporter substrate-binding protein [Actinomycetota bacterium]